jgi:two-component system chemotaxis response regulator CheB
LAQDQDSSVVWGMPGTAVRLGAAQQQLPLGGIAARLLELAGAGSSLGSSPSSRSAASGR